MIKREQMRYEALYQSILSNLYVGNLVYGESLPPLRAICEQYHVGMSVVRAALQKLEDDGYILTAQGKRAVVVYSSSATDNTRALLERRTGITETFDGMALLLTDPFYASLRLCSAEDLERAGRLLEETPGASHRWKALIDRTTVLISLLLRPLRNPLLVDLFSEMRLFTRLPDCHLGVEEGFVQRYFTKVDEFFQRLISRPFLEREDQAHRFAVVCDRMKQEDLTYLEHVVKAPEADFEAVPFRWSASKGQAMYVTVALELLNQMMLGVYPEGTLLPPVSALMEQYEISSTTARSACTMLCRMGVAQTVNGVGTRVLLRQGGKLLESEQDGMLHKSLVSLLCALQMIALTIRRTAQASFEQLDQDTFQNLHRRLAQVLANAPRYQAHTLLLRVLIAHGPNRCVSTVYSEVFELLYWGLYLLTTQTARAEEDLTALYTRLLESARLRDPVGLADCLEQIYLDEYRFCRLRVLELGVLPEQIPCPLDNL